MFVEGLGELAVFPCNAEKQPLTRRGFYDAKVIEPPGHWPLVGVPTGVASGFDVIDIDPEGLGWLAEHRLETRRHKTQRGWHLLVRAGDLSGSADDRIAGDVHVRGNGNYVIWWPREGLEVIDLPLAAWPAELMAKAKAKHSASARRSAFNKETPTREGARGRVLVSPGSREGRYGRAALRNAFTEVAEEERGHRAWMLNKQAFKMGGLVANGWLDGEVVVKVLMLGARSCGLVREEGEDRCRAMIRCGLEAGMELPYPALGLFEDVGQ